MDKTSTTAGDVDSAPWAQYIRDHCTPEQQAAIYAYAMKLLTVPEALNDALETELRILAEQAEKLLTTSL